LYEYGSGEYSPESAIGAGAAAAAAANATAIAAMVCIFKWKKKRIVAGTETREG
jgi:formiminotetrahydrofolate cyclodeaminase